MDVSICVLSTDTLTVFWAASQTSLAPWELWIVKNEMLALVAILSENYNAQDYDIFLHVQVMLVVDSNWDMGISN